MRRRNVSDAPIESAEVSTPARAKRVPTMVIEPRKGWFDLELGELWRYRELGYFLVWRDIKVRFKQTVVGALWAIIQPVVLMVVFTFVFGKFGGKLAPPPGIPRPIFYFAALLPWSYFSQALLNSTGSVVGSQTIVTRVYFPRLILPLEAVFPGFLDYIMAAIVLIVLMFAYHVPFSFRLLAIPPITLIAALAAFGAGAWLSGSNALYRDIREGTPFLVQILMFTSPVVLPASRLPVWFRPIYALDPMTGVIEAIRWAVVGHAAFPTELVLISLGVSLLLVITGVIYFRRIEEIIVDVV